MTTPSNPTDKELYYLSLTEQYEAIEELEAISEAELDAEDAYRETTAMDHMALMKRMPLSREDTAVMNARWADLLLLQEVFKDFGTFLLAMYKTTTNFQCSPIQQDIARFLAAGPQRRMIQAQRGQAKTTITAAYAVWRLIHDPRTRCLVFSAASGMAGEVASFVIQIINSMPHLECLRPDVGKADRLQRASIKAFDVHWSLKGVDKSPSIACMGITSSMQGRRADVLIADDIESSKNSLTQLARDTLTNYTYDFTSICSNGDIIYLGTPQSSDSIYNGLTARGYTIRIWPGRYPTVKEEENYNGNLADIIQFRLHRDPSLRSGGGPVFNRGQAVDPVLIPERSLVEKEVDQGAAYFQLQHMLDTRLNDALRYPLKPENALIMRITPTDDDAPSQLRYIDDPKLKFDYSNQQALQIQFTRAHIMSTNVYMPWQGGKMMYIDPAGGGKNGDETAFCVAGMVNGYVYILDVGGFIGGFDEDSLTGLALKAKEWGVQHIRVEKNFGYGAFEQMLRPVLALNHVDATVDDDTAIGQKEPRMAQVIEPILNRHKLIINELILENEVKSTASYPVASRQSYQFLFQMKKLTLDRDSLIHDDRLDAMHGAVKYWVEWLAVDEHTAIAKHNAAQYTKMMENPLQKNVFLSMDDFSKSHGQRSGMSNFGSGRNRSRFVKKR
jgi:hypothetical protein